MPGDFCFSVQIDYICRWSGIQAPIIVVTQVVLNISNKKDLPFMRHLSKKMGWSYYEYSVTDNDAYREAMDDIAAGRVYTAASAEDMVAQILG